MEANDMAACREALKYADEQLRMATESATYGDDVVYLVGCMRAVAAACRAALAKPPRNCDVGTPDEQAERFYAFCTRFSSGIGGMCDGNCPCLGSADGCHCLCKWEQMPYKEESNDGQ